MPKYRAVMDLFHNNYLFLTVFSKDQRMYLQPIITQYFIDNKSEIWLSLIHI